MTQHERIFVSIASYRDGETPATLHDLFTQASHPERVFVGVLWQVHPLDDPNWLCIPCHSHQVQGQVVEASQSRGVCWARHRIQQQFWQEEDYYFQIDSHTRFDPGWDNQLIAQLAACPSPKPILSTYPNSYYYPDVRTRQGIPILRAQQFSKDGVLMLQKSYLAFSDPPRPPQPAAFLGGGFVFTRREFVHQVPYDPLLYFTGEEITMAVRAWTHGFDIFSPNQVILYHEGDNARRRPRHWHDHERHQSDFCAPSYARVRHLLGVAPSQDSEVTKGLEHYGLGQARTLQEYERFADVDFQRQKIGLRALDGLFPSPEDYQPEILTLSRTFAAIYQENRWNARETRSGGGSTYSLTASLREALAQTLQQIGIRILVDAGCGDMIWLAPITQQLTLYLGFDVVEEMIANNRRLYSGRKNHFFNLADISRQVLPQADAILCRNTLTHLTQQGVMEALACFRASGTPFLLATTYPGQDNREIHDGQWRAMDLCQPPFNLPPPLLLLKDGGPEVNRYLGLWRLTDATPLPVCAPPPAGKPPGATPIPAP